ncbi:ATP-binding protein [Millisia brevis]|uniref:ATP-binding protein n=1 Tax=Millisia brevis TaxID=264148 RepID=UPI00082E4B43|nr:ATP-binding protein [Millisia brevis]
MTPADTGAPTTSTGRIAAALGRHHTLPTAVADLIDNSIDADAGHVLVRFLQDGPRVEGLRIIDDGHGMTEATLARAVTYQPRDTYGPTDLGHFGVGLGASSFSQADRYTVWTVAAGSAPVGRTLHRSAPDEVRIEDPAEAERRIAGARPRFPMVTGTIVDWHDVRTFLTVEDDADRIAWLESTIADLRTHLGVVFHRLIERGLRITIDVFDVALGRPGASRTVSAIDPFGYTAPGRADYPRPITVPLPGTDLTATAHLWPARDTSPRFRLYGAPGRDRQGLYVYRHDRLLQIGGWSDLWHARPDFAPARVVIDMTPAVEQHVVINPEKSGITLTANAIDALRTALGGPRGWYLSDAGELVRNARRHQPRPVTLVEPESGLPEDVLDEITDSVEFDADADAVRIGWRVLARDSFFEVNLEQRTLWLNARFRRALVGYRSAADTDAPVLRSLVYLLAEDLFSGTRLGRAKTDRLRAWQNILIAAVTSHIEQQEARREHALD